LQSFAAALYLFHRAEDMPIVLLPCLHLEDKVEALPKCLHPRVIVYAVINPNGGHWISLRIDFAARSIQFYDPLGPNRKGIPEKYVRYLTDYGQCNGKGSEELTAVQKIGPTQKNGIDCGAFSLSWICCQLFYPGRNDLFNQSLMTKIRRRLIIVTTFGSDKFIADCFRLLVNNGELISCIDALDIPQLFCTCQEPHQIDCMHGFDLLCTPTSSFLSQYGEEIKKYNDVFNC
jgi:hypothetical protein